MLLQTLCMSLWYNSALTFQVLKQGDHVVPFFQGLLELLPGLKHEFELRRVIFGLTAVISTNPQFLPPVVLDRLPDITKSLA